MVDKVIHEAENVSNELTDFLITKEIKNMLVSYDFRIKEKESYINRMKRFNQKPGQVDDLIGYCFIVEGINDCYNTLKHFKNNRNITINNVMDYIKEPCGENKYRAIHIKFKYKKSLGEIQIKTKQMDLENKKSYINYKNKKH